MPLPGKILIAITVVHAMSLAISVQGADGLPHPDVTTTNLSSSPKLEAQPGPDEIWLNDSVGAGFRSGVEQAGGSLGVGYATHELGGKTAHDLVLARLYYGWMLGNVAGGDHWYRGNWEVLEEIFGGLQFRPDSRYVLVETTLFRYNLATGSRWVPFLDAGLGAAATDIGRPDLGSIFEFNEQVGPGVNYFWRQNCALTFQYRFLHISNAGIRRPNEGVNENMLCAGVSWFF
jgi:lipid A 3-O-deacylase